jgi:hypothetical protein
MGVRTLPKGLHLPSSRWWFPEHLILVVIPLSFANLRKLLFSRKEEDIEDIDQNDWR